jgi:hypothetical protein
MKEFDIGAGWMEVEVHIRSWRAEGVKFDIWSWMDGWMDGWMSLTSGVGLMTEFNIQSWIWMEEFGI